MCPKWLLLVLEWGGGAPRSWEPREVPLPSWSQAASGAEGEGHGKVGCLPGASPSVHRVVGGMAGVLPSVPALHGPGALPICGRSPSPWAWGGGPAGAAGRAEPVPSSPSRLRGPGWRWGPHTLRPDFTGRQGELRLRDPLWGLPVRVRGPSPGGRLTRHSHRPIDRSSEPRGCPDLNCGSRVWTEASQEPHSPRAWGALSGTRSLMEAPSLTSSCPRSDGVRPDRCAPSTQNPSLCRRPGAGRGFAELQVLLPPWALVGGCPCVLAHRPPAARGGALGPPGQHHPEPPQPECRVRSAGAGLQPWESPWKDTVFGASLSRTGHTRPTQSEGGRRGAHSLSEHTPRGQAHQGFCSRTP